MLKAFGTWLAGTQLSLLFQDTLWVVPLSQSIHIASVAVLFASAMMINARLLGFGRQGRSVSELMATLVPWMWRALACLLITGTVQTIAEPVRQFVTPIYWGKMALIVIVSILTVRTARTVRANAAAWDDSKSRPASARGFAIASSLLWIVIVIFGRFIGYVWSFYL